MHCVVLGAGVAGLVAAIELLRRSCRVTIVEAAPFAGGRAASWQTSSGLRTGSGLHVAASHYHNLLEVAASTGAGESHDEKKAHARNRSRNLAWWREHRYLRAGESPVRLKYNRLPAPFHLAHAVHRMPLSWSSRLRLLRVAGEVALLAHDEFQALDNVTYLDWHSRHGLPSGFLLEFAELAADAALFLPLDRASAWAVLSWIRNMSSSGGASAIGTWRPSISEGLISPLVSEIERLGGTLRFGEAAVDLEIEAGRMSEVMVRRSAASRPSYERDGCVAVTGPLQPIRCDAVISALHFPALRRLLSSGLSAEAGLTQISELGAASAISLTVALDRRLEPVPIGVPLVTGCSIRDFIDFAWLNGEPRSTVQFLLRNSPDWEERTDQEIVSAALHDLACVWPGAGRAQLVESAVERIPAAMFAAEPGSHRFRPGTTTAIPNFFLAGDWVHPSLNACMESASISGRLAASAVLHLGDRNGGKGMIPLQPAFVKALRALQPALRQPAREIS
jgi:zeta-carotene desaturase